MQVVQISKINFRISKKQDQPAEGTTIYNSAAFTMSILSSKHSHTQRQRATRNAQRDGKTRSYLLTTQTHTIPIKKSPTMQQIIIH
jgi:hypothetical protein